MEFFRLNTQPAGDTFTSGYESGSPESERLWDRGWPQTSDEFGLLVDVYLDRLVLSAFRRLGNTQDAEDVVQEVFVRVYNDRFKRTNISQVGPYLYRMVNNACMDFLRKRKRQGSALEEIRIDSIPGAQNNQSDTETDAYEEILRAEELLTRLPKKQAEVIRLRVFDELRLNEIAEVAGCSIDTVSSRLRYGFRKLRKIVSRERKKQ